MDITWLGLSCFRIRGSQAVIITDPFPPSLGYSLGRQTADIVTVSHPHPGHSYAEGVEGKPRIVRGPGEYEISNVLILGIATYHDAVRGGTRGKNTVYLMEVDGVNILHLGDIGHVLSGEQAEEIGRVDVLLLPVGGVNTIGAATAAQLVRSLEPKVVIPMHYRTPQLKRELEPLDGFLREMGLTQVEPRAKLTLNRNTLPQSTQVVVLAV